MTSFHLSARVSSQSPRVVRAPLDRFVGKKAKIRPCADGFEVEAEIEGGSARELNRQLLSEMRRVEKRTRLRAQWTSGGATERFFDYVPKGVRKTENDPIMGPK
jgi:hypothetical protein